MVPLAIFEFKRWHIHMGNNVVAGHAINVATSGQRRTSFQQTLELTMRIHDIQLWSPKALLQERLEQQKALSKVSPFRFINIVEGFGAFAPYVDGWIHRLTRERFVELSLEMFKKRRIQISPDDARIFYDVFDSVDLYKNAELSAGELAGGLNPFFGGSIDERTQAIFDLLAPSAKSGLTRASLKSFVKPYVWCMVPETAAVLRPLLVDHVAEDLFVELSMQGGGSTLSLETLRRWVRQGVAGANIPVAAEEGQALFSYAKKLEMQQFTCSNKFVERVTCSIETNLNAALREYQARIQLREYGKQTWNERHAGRPQYLKDVGLYRYFSCTNAGGPSPSSGLADASCPWSTLTGSFANFIENRPQAPDADQKGHDPAYPARLESPFSTEPPPSVGHLGAD